MARILLNVFRTDKLEEKAMTEAEKLRWMLTPATQDTIWENPLYISSFTIGEASNKGICLDPAKF